MAATRRPLPSDGVMEPAHRRMRRAARVVLTGLAALLPAACTRPSNEQTVITFPASAVGAEAELLDRQLARFMHEHPDVRVVQRKTPDAANQRHQLYVQWLNARMSDPDILQLDVIWSPEFAAAGWILPLDQFNPDMAAFFPATLAANRWKGQLYALPWFVDVGMLYWRSDLLDHAPESFEELQTQAADAKQKAAIPFGFVWQGARYEGLVTVFLEYLGGFGGHILDESGNIVVDSEQAVRALREMRDSIYKFGTVPQDVLTWQEEPVRFAFQNGRAVFMRNWPYAYPLMEAPAESKVAGKFAVAPMPHAPGGSSTAALGGSQLAINRNTEHPEAAYALIAFLTRPEQMLERARVVGQYPTRIALYERAELDESLAIPREQARRIIERAVPRPVTPVYTELSEILQIWLHRALTQQAEPQAALRSAAREMRRVLAESGLSEVASQ
jgi:multiple sugar transport system substrate-binding protein